MTLKNDYFVDTQMIQRDCRSVNERQKAYDIIDEAKNTTLKDVSSVTVILLTDGKPTYHIGGGNGEDTKNAEYHNAEMAAGNLKRLEENRNLVLLYSIAFATSDKFYHDEFRKNITVYDWLDKKIADQTFGATDEVSLDGVFQVINKIMQVGPSAWRVYDPMAANIVYTDAQSGNCTVDAAGEWSGNKFSYNADTGLEWNLLQSGREQTTSTDTAGNVQNTYLYSLTYSIRLDNTAQGFMFDSPQCTNETKDSSDQTKGTILKYFFQEDVNASTDVQDILKNAYFDVPEVKGYKTDTALTFTKVDADDSSIKLENAKFKLEVADCHSSHLGDTVQEDGTTRKYNLLFTKFLSHIRNNKIDAFIYYISLLKI